MDGSFTGLIQTEFQIAQSSQQSEKSTIFFSSKELLLTQISFKLYHRNKLLVLSNALSSFDF
jgi:hypothetical protein